MSFSAGIFHYTLCLPTELISQDASLFTVSLQADALIASLRHAKPWEALCANWPCLLSAAQEMGGGDFPNGVETLLRQHLHEWSSFGALAGA